MRARTFVVFAVTFVLLMLAVGAYDALSRETPATPTPVEQPCDTEPGPGGSNLFPPRVTA